jgi:hypothetical protein
MKKIMIGLLVIAGLIAVTASCSPYKHVCYAKKVGNHR